MKENLHWNTDTSEVSRVRTRAITKIHTSALRNRLPINKTPFPYGLGLDSLPYTGATPIKRLRRLGRDYAFGGARTGDFWLLAAGLLVWRWAFKRRRQ
jgi:hypothetical protein